MCGRFSSAHADAAWDGVLLFVGGEARTPPRAVRRPPDAGLPLDIAALVASAGLVTGAASARRPTPAGLAFLLLYRRVSSRFGRALVAIRENERRMAAIGYPVYRLKLVAFTLSGGLAGLAGALLANLMTGITPHSLNWHQSGLLMVMVILGGAGRFWGGLMGAGIFLLLEETISAHTEHWNLVLGALLLFIVMVAPNGVMSLHQRLRTTFRRWRAP